MHFTLSLHFIPGLQSAVCSLRFTLTGYLGGFWQQRLIIRNAIASVAVSNGSQIWHFYRIITLRIEPRYLLFLKI